MIWGVGFGAWNFGLRVQISGFENPEYGLGFRVWSLGLVFEARNAELGYGCYISSARCGVKARRVALCLRP